MARDEECNHVKADLKHSINIIKLNKETVKIEYTKNIILKRDGEALLSESKRQFGKIVNP